MLQRRDFFLAPGLAAATRLLSAQDDPFDALPATVWHNASLNGLVMIRRPAPTVPSSRTRITRTRRRPGLRSRRPHPRSRCHCLCVQHRHAGLLRRESQRVPSPHLRLDEDRPGWPFRVADLSGQSLPVIWVG